MLEPHVIRFNLATTAQTIFALIDALSAKVDAVYQKEQS